MIVFLLKFKEEDILFFALELAKPFPLFGTPLSSEPHSWFCQFVLFKSKRHIFCVVISVDWERKTMHLSFTHAPQGENTSNL